MCVLNCLIYNLTHVNNLGYDCPYLCALLPPNIIEIRSIEPYILIQKIILGKSITMIASGIP